MNDVTCNWKFHSIDTCIMGHKGFYKTFMRRSFLISLWKAYEVFDKSNLNEKQVIRANRLPYDRFYDHLDVLKNNSNCNLFLLAILYCILISLLPWSPEAEIEIIKAWHAYKILFANAKFPILITFVTTQFFCRK